MKYPWKKYAIILSMPVITIIFIYLACLVFLWFMRIEDVSNEPTADTCNTNLSGHVWLISYADGDDVHFKNQRYLVHSAINKCINSFRSYSAQDIAPLYKKDHADILSQKRGMGYWLWKPYIILKTLESIPENDIVVYIDSGVFFIKSIDTLLNHLTNHEIVVFKGEESWTNKRYVKRDLLKMMGADNDYIRNMVQLQASYILLKNTAFTREYIKKWLRICENEKAITDTPSKDEYPEFFDHRHDQSILTLLYYAQSQDKIYTGSLQETEECFWHHRRSKAGSDIFLPKQRRLKRINKFWKELTSPWRLFFRQLLIFPVKHHNTINPDQTYHNEKR